MDLNQLQLILLLTPEHLFGIICLYRPSLLAHGGYHLTYSCYWWDLFCVSGRHGR